MGDTIYIEGNKGGDYLRIHHIKDNILRIEVAHCCVVSVKQEMPIEVLTKILTEASFGDFEGGLRDWSDDFGAELQSKMKKLTFFDKV